ncbi:MAG: class I tRNA ligase family protein, partial [Erythrobacter sp.]
GIDTADMLNMFDGDANVVQTADGLIPEEFIGLHRFRRDGTDGARERVVERMKELGCLIPHKAKTKKGEEVELDAEPRQIATPFGDRGGVVIEPWLTDQWYLDQKALAQKPIEQVRSGEVEIVPASWEKTFFNWMENILPWCISRQLWWGHRIPAWFSLDGEVFVAETREEAQRQAGEGVAIQQDEDVLDTWFSSALWPFATLGWPEQSDLLAKHFPNSLLVSGFDILFFWDARMLMMGNYNMGAAPWPRLYLHGLVRAADGAKMSKSKGNVVDPLGLIDQYGADALRFFMAAMESQGRDIKMDERRVEGYRNFATKLWNAARFCQSNGIGASGSLKAPAARLAANQWIIGEVAETARAIEQAMADLRFDAAASAIYHFVWDRFCDWYLELIKPVFAGDPDAMPAVETREVAAWALDQILVMLHPFMPFITEELWHSQAEMAETQRPYELILAKWPEPEAEISKAATDAIDWVIDVISGARAMRNEISIPQSLKITLGVDRRKITDEQFESLEKLILGQGGAALFRLAKIGSFTFYNTGIRINLETREREDRTQEPQAVPGSGASFAVGGIEYITGLEGIIDIEAEKARLAKALEASRKEAKSLEGRLGNPNFVEKAKPEAVEKAREDHAHHTAEIERLEAALARLG